MRVAPQSQTNDILKNFSRIRNGPPTRKGPDSGSHRTGAPGRGSERGTAGGPPSRAGVGVGFKAWADPSQMVVWLPGKKKNKTSGPVTAGWPYTHAHTHTRMHTAALLLIRTKMCAHDQSPHQIEVILTNSWPEYTC